jgi:RNA polymerase sigma-70 factor (ECF subfamily)
LREASGLGRVYPSRMGTAPDPERQFAAPAGLARRVEELYTAHARLVRSICRSLLRDRNEAEDAMQQTFLSAQRALANGSSPREPAAWLATMRERMREPLPVEAEPTELGADAHSAAVSRYEVATLREALADLPRAQREAILLRELRGLSYDEVARALSVTTGAVESLIFRARRTLQVRLSEALTALSPVALLGRLLGGGGDLAGPAVAKVAAIGVGAAMLAGGAALGPRAFGPGHAATKVKHSAPPVHVQAAPPVVSTPLAHIWSPPSPQSGDTHQAEREATVAENASSSDIAERSSPESSSREISSSETSSSESESGSGSGAVSTGTPTPAAHPSRGDGGDGSNDSSGSGD